jgi:TRAP-type C4-dicarboxylate transport system substrate-binding protein
MKKFSIILAIMLISTMVVIGCGTPEPTVPAPTTPAPAPSAPTKSEPVTSAPVTPAKPSAPAPSTPAPAQPKVYKLYYTDHNPATTYGTVNATNPWLDQIEEATNGQVKIERYYGETLAKGTDAWMAVQKGVADIGWCSMGYWAGLTPLSDVIALPILGFKSNAQASGILWKLLEKFPEIKAEYADVQPLVFLTTGPYFIITTKKPVKDVDDLKGLKIRVLSGPQTDTLKALGAVPMLVAAPELYTSMQKGTIDGQATTWGMMEIFNTYEVIKYVNEMPLFYAYMSLVMNKQKFERMPKDIQDAIMSVCGYEGTRWYAGHNTDFSQQAGMKEVEEYEEETGNIIERYDPSPDEFAKFQQIGAKPAWDAWVKKMEDQGLPGQAVLDEVLKLVASEPH